MSGNHTLQLPETDDIAALLAEVMPREEPSFPPSDDLFSAFDDAPPPRTEPASVRMPRGSTGAEPSAPIAGNGFVHNQSLESFFRGINWNNIERKADAPAPSRHKQIEAPVELVLTQMTFGKFCKSINWPNRPDAPALAPESIAEFPDDLFGDFVDERTGGKPGADWQISNVMNEFVWD